MEDTKEVDGYQIMVVNITYGREINQKIKERPNMTVLDVPDGILKHMNNASAFHDMVESFAYNTVTKKYGAEVAHCQVFLP